MCQMSEEKKKAWIAISGTMASGKSSVLAYLKRKGYPVYDCDAINASLQEKGEEGYEKIVEVFGHGILNEQMEYLSLIRSREQPHYPSLLFSVSYGYDSALNKWSSFLYETRSGYPHIPYR